jgi:peptide/nickel transport system permease protein
MNQVNVADPTKVLLTKKQRKFLVDLFIRLFTEKPLGAIGGVMILGLLIIAIIAPFIAPHPPNEIYSLDAMKPPSSQYIMGTDNYGRDLFSRIIYGAQISMTVGLAVPFIQLLISVLIGITSGFVGGKLDIFVQRIVDSWMCFPGLLILLTIMSILGPGLAQVIIVLGISGGIGMSRTVRSAVIGIKNNAYIEGATAIGSRTMTTLVRHILPNIMPVLIILFTMHMAGAILAEASLSFLGFGIPQTTPSWGGMLSGAGRKYMLIAPWMALWPGLALSIAVFGISMLGDAVRDILDPRLKGGLGRYGSGKAKKLMVKALKKQ